MSPAATQAARAVADLSQGVILASVEITAAVDRVFQALTDPNEIPRWWGSTETYRTEEWSADLRVGGRWRARGRGVDGKSFSVEGEFLEVDPPRKLVQTWKADWDGGHLTTVSYQLDPIRGGTRVTVRHSGFGERRDSCKGHSEGWEEVLTWLHGHLSSPSYFLCRLLPPRPTFQQDVSDSEKRLMQEHAGYWTELCDRGVAIIFGPVADPKGGWGVGILRARDREQVSELQAKDPAIRSGLGFQYEVLSMPRVVLASELRTRERTNP